MHPFITQKIAAERVRDMQAQVTLRRCSRVATRSRRSAAPASEKARGPFSSAKSERIQRRQLEKSVSWTIPERLRFLWYWFCLTTNDMHYVSGWLIALPPPPYVGSHEGRERPWSAS